MNPGDRVILAYQNRTTQRWHRLTAEVKKADPPRAQLRIIAPSLPDLATWDCRKLLGNREVWIEDMARGRALRAIPVGAAGANLSIEDMTTMPLPEAAR